MSLSDEIKAAIGSDGKSRHQTRCLYDYWAIKAEKLEAERDRLQSLLINLYNQGYLAGHHDTVESQYTHIVSEDMNTYHADIVAELLEES